MGEYLSFTCQVEISLPFSVRCQGLCGFISFAVSVQNKSNGLFQPDLPVTDLTATSRPTRVTSSAGHLFAQDF